MRCEHAHLDGAYVLGALGPAERAAYQAHLAECRECAAAVSALAPMPGLLGRVDPRALPEASPGSGPLPALLRAVVGERRQEGRRRRSRLLTAVGATVVVMVLAFAGWTALVSGSDEPEAPMAAMEPVGVVAPPVTAELAVLPAPGGSEVRLECRYWAIGYDGPPRTFRLVALGADGTSEQLSSWQAAPGETVTATGLTHYTGRELVRLELRDAEDAPLLAYDMR